MPAKMELAYYQKLPTSQLKQLVHELTEFKATLSNRVGKQWCVDFIDMLQVIIRQRSK